MAGAGRGLMMTVHRKFPTKMRNDAPSRKALTEEKSFQHLQVGRVLEHPPGLAQKADDEQREERQVEEDEHRPEVDLAPLVVHDPPGQLGRPVVDAGEEGEDEPAHDGVVEVGQHEKAPVDGHVDRDVRQEHTGHAADEEIEEHPQAEQHRHFQAGSSLSTGCPGPPGR